MEETQQATTAPAAPAHDGAAPPEQRSRAGIVGCKRDTAR
jgi:hypothetical protein